MMADAEEKIDLFSPYSSLLLKAVMDGCSLRPIQLSAMPLEAASL